MSVGLRLSALCLAFVLSLVAVNAPRAAQAEVTRTVLALAGPLAERYGVSADAVSGLLEKGVSLETVTQLLLVKESSGKSLDAVTDLYEQKGKDVSKAAGELGVDPKAYSSENVQAAIDQAKTDAAASASDKASEAAGGALDSLLGGGGAKD